MKVLLIDNGSPTLGPIRAALGSHALEVLGYPFVPETLATRARGAARIVFSGSSAPHGVDLAYVREITKAVGAVTVPVLGIGLGAAVLLEAHGGKVKRTAAGFSLKKAPTGWREEKGLFTDGSGNIAALESGDWRRALDMFFR